MNAPNVTARRLISPLQPLSIAGWLLVILLVAPFFVVPSLAADPSGQGNGETIEVDSWLILGPSPWPLPAFAEASYGAGELLQEPSLDLEALWPAEGSSQVLRPGSSPTPWSVGIPWTKSRLSEGVPYKSWAASYLDVEFFAEVKLEVTSRHPVLVYLDGAEVASRPSPGDDDGPLTADLTLTPGKHLLLVASVRNPESKVPWKLTAALTGARPSAGLAISTSPRRHVGLTELIDQPTVRGLDLSPDGRYLAIQWSNVAVPAEHRVSWWQIVDAADGEVLEELRGDISDFAWSPDGSRYAWTAATDVLGGEGKDLWMSKVGGGASERVLENLENWAGLTWLPDGSGWVISTSEPSEPDERGFKHYRGLTDRWAGARDRLHLWWLPVSGGGLRRLTVGESTDTLVDVGQGRLLLLRLDYDELERPYQRSHLYELDLETLESRQVVSAELIDSLWLGDARYVDPASSDDHRLVVVGSPAFSSGAGRDPDLVPEVVVNDYELEAYLFDPATGSVDAFTRDWDPTVNAWQVAGGALWMLGQDRSYQRIYRYDFATGTLAEIPSGSDVAGSLDVSQDGSRLAYLGEGPSDPAAVYVRGADPEDLPRRIARGGDEAWQRVDLGRVETFSFVMDEGTENATEILGRVNYPPGFDPAKASDKKLPLIVSYYGGTVPSERSFGGRYPRSYWAAHGFVVYTVQPSGATGFGQEFSARHVGAWGRRTADEIVEGTKRFLDAHPFVDRDKVGCIGASYGGFMTMYLVSHSDLFAAAVSHAGISNLASYWGKGWWGYLYSATASADSFPWNDRDLYIDQSPLYAADRIHTPLLLLHGDQDTNVPPVESHQMYTALKLLGRDVELIEVGGENHQIFTYAKRKLWMETIVAYFTKYLMDRPEWWSDLWGTPDDPKG